MAPTPPTPPTHPTEDSGTSEDYLDKMIAERRAKADAMRAAGANPYANDWKPDAELAKLREGYAATKPVVDADVPKERKKGITTVDEQIYRVAGRLIAKRGFGKTVFAPIRDTTGEIQLYINVDHCENFEQVVGWLDVGDIVGAEGGVFWTNKGELSILVKKLRVLTKSLRPLPEKWHGLSDVETRYRQRYLDMIVNGEVRDTFRKRSRMVSGIRRFLDERDFLEVETPMMHPIVGGAAARPFTTHHNALDLEMYLRIAPELYLKRLVVGGFDRVYEINRNFRNEGLSRQHNPEFTMLEFYMAYATYHDLMRLTEEMIVALARDITGGTKVVQDGVEIDLSPPWRRLSVRDAVVEVAGKSTEVFEDPDVGGARCRPRGSA